MISKQIDPYLHFFTAAASIRDEIEDNLIRHFISLSLLCIFDSTEKYPGRIDDYK